MSRTTHPDFLHPIDIEAWLTDSRTCPECSCPVIWDFGCRTYSGERRWYACLQCDSAVELHCVCAHVDQPEHSCRWNYTWGLNPDNPRAAENEQRRPGWLKEDYDGGRPDGLPFLTDDWEHYLTPSRCCADSTSGETAPPQ